MPATSLLGFWITALLLIAVPGADWAFTLDAAVRRRVLPAVAGLVTGYLILTGLVATGVGALVVSSPRALTTLTLVGGAYLVGHGCLTVLRPPTLPTATPMPASSGRPTLVRGIGVSGLNPKGLLLFLALLPQFTTTGDLWPIAAQTATLGLVFVATCALFYLGLGALAGHCFAGRPTPARVLGRLAGGSMATVGVLLVLDRLGA